MGEELDAIYQKKAAVWKKWMTQKVVDDPMTWLLITLWLFEENPEFIHRWKVFETLLTHDVTRSHHEALWSVYLHRLAHNPKLKNSHTQWHLKNHFELIPREFEQVVLDHALLGASGPMTVPMLVHYFAVRICTPEVLVMSLRHKSKKVRDAAVTGACNWPVAEAAGSVVALLGERKKDTRLYAAMALKNIPVACVAPYQAVLEEATVKEKYDVVSESLRSVLGSIDVV